MKIVGCVNRNTNEQNVGTHFHAVFTAGGTWQAAAIYPPGQPEEPLELRTPDQPMPSCACQPLKLDYNPNTEDQTDFHCISELSWQVSIMHLSYIVG